MSGAGNEYDAAVISLNDERAKRVSTPVPTVPQKGPDEYDRAFTLMDDAATLAAKGSVAGAADANPEHVGRAIQLAPKVGVPAAAVEQNLPAFEAQHHLQESARVIQSTPALATWLAADQQRARVAKDDFDQLGMLSKTWTAFSTGWVSADFANQRGRLGAAAATGADVMPEVRQVEQKLQGTPELHGVYGALQKVGGFTGGLLDNFMRGIITGGVVGATGGAVIGGAPTGGVGAVPGAIIGGVGGTGVGFKMDAARVAAGNTYLDLTELEGKDGAKVPVPAKEAAALVVGLGTYALFSVGASGASKATADARAKLLKDAVVQATTKPTVARALGNFSKTMVKNGVTGAALMTAIEGVNIFGEELGKQLAGGQDFHTVFNDPLQQQQAVDQLITAATDGAMLIPLAHLPMAVASLLGDTMRARAAKADVEAFQQVETGAVASKTRGRSLDAFQSFMQHQTGGSPVEHIGLTGEAVRTLYQSAGVEPGPGDGLLGDIVPDIREQVRQVTETGGDIIVPTAGYVAHLAGTPLSESLRADIRFRPDGMTLREAAEYEKVRGEHLADLATNGQASIDAEFAASEPGRAVYQDVFGKLRAAGQTVDAASQYATLVAERYAARAERLGRGDALSLYREQGLDIRREVPDSLRHVATDEQDLVINALRDTGRKVPKDRDLFGPSLHEAVKAAGGIVDTGGELRAMDLHLAKTKGLIRKATGDQKDDINHSMDAMALRMWEMGYFSDKMERPTEQDLIDAMRGGDTRYAEGAGNERRAAFEEAVRDLDEFVNRQGIDPAKASNEEIKAAIAKHIAEQDAEGGRELMQGERGRISIDNGRSVITLLKDADLSTFLHETGHMWLEEMLADARLPETPEAVKADVAKIMEHLGMKSVDEEPTVEQHETFARSMETYLMEGRAPSAALASAFRRFKSWLIRIYKTVASLNAPINDELRGVFDRMVASDTAIQSWRQAEGLLPMDKKSLGMTDAEYEAYEKGLEKARNSADEKMLRKTMSAIRKERTAEWKAEEASVRDDVSQRVRSRRDLKAQYFLRTGKLLDDPEASAAEKTRISRDALNDMYGTDEASKALPSGIVAAEGGSHPDELADLFGYKSGDELVRSLMSLESSKRQAEEATGKTLDGQKYVRHLIDTETRETMLDRHGDALNDGSIEEEALAAVHNRAQADVLAAETRAIARQAGKIPLTLDDVNIWADNQIADMSTKRGTDQAAFARLEAKAWREGQRALLKGDMEAAFEAKQRQMVNHVLARKAGEMREEYDRAMSSMKKLGKSPTRDSIQQPFMDQAHAILDRLNIATKRSDADAAATPTLREFVERQAAEGQDVFVPEFLLDERYHADAADMNLGEFMDAADAVKSIIHLGRQMREMDIEGEKIRFAEIVDDMRNVIGDRTRGEIGYTHAVTKSEKAMLAVLTARAGLRRMDSWALQMDRGDRNGPFTKYIVRPVYAALDKYRPAKAEYLQKLWDIIGPLRKELNQGKIDAPEIGYTFANKGELLHAISHTGNDSNMRKLLLGREWGEMDKDGNLDDGRWRAMVQRFADTGVLKQSDFDTVQKLWDLLEELKPGAQAANKEIYGVRFNEITSRPTWTPFGELRGGYMPAITDRLMARDGQIREDSQALREQQTGAMFPSTGRGFTKARVENYAEPLELNLALIPSHMDSVLRFTHLQPTIRDVGRLMLKRSFKDMMRGVDPSVVSGMIVPWLQRTARQTQLTPAADPVGRLGDKALNVLRRRSGLQILAFNLTNTLQQLVGVAPGVLKSSPGAMVRSLYEYAKSPIQTANRIAEASPFMDERMRNKSYDIMLSLKAALEDTTKLDEVKHWGERNGHVLQTMTQNVVDIATWQAAYEHATAGGMTHADAVYAADAAVRETQGGFNPEDLSRFETGTSLGRLFSHMYSYFGSQANLIGTEAALIKELGFKAGASRAAMVYTFGLMIPALVGEAIYRTAAGGWGQDEDKGEAEALLDFFVGAQAKYLAPMVPIAGPVAMAVLDRQQGDRIGTSPAVSTVKQSTRAPAEIKAALVGEKAPGPAVRDSMTALGLMTGLPLGQAGRPLGYLADVATGWQRPESAADVGRGLVTGRQEIR